MINAKEYSRPVRRSLLHRDLVAGIPQSGVFILLFAALIFLYGFEMYFMLIPIAILYVVMRVMTNRDPWMIDMMLSNIQQKDVYIP